MSGVKSMASQELAAEAAVIVAAARREAMADFYPCDECGTPVDIDMGEDPGDPSYQFQVTTHLYDTMDLDHTATHIIPF